MGGEAYAFGEMVGHAELLKAVYSPFVNISPGSAGMEARESLSTHLKKKEMVTERFLFRHFPCSRQVIGEGELEHVFWFPGLESPADGMTRVKSDVYLFFVFWGREHFVRDFRDL